MLQWNELRITPDSKFIVLDVEVQNLDFYKDIYIKSIYIEAFNSPDKFINAMPTTSSEEIWSSEDTTTKHVKKYIDIDTISNNMFFIYALAEGTPAPNTPCNCKDPLLVGVVYDDKLIYNSSVMSILSTRNCAGNRKLLDFIFKEKALELSLKTGDYKAAIGYWEMLTKNTNTITNSCNCNGY